jgi:sporulation protein YlmC with PRC-barrel domain
MRTPYLVGGLLAAALMSSTAFAQTNPPATPRAPAATTDVAPKTMSNQWRASKLIGLNVYNEQNEKLGDINEILLDPTGKVTGYVIGVGGFLGMGEHNILVEPSKIKFVNEPVRTTTSSNTTTTTGAPTTTPTGAPTNTRNVAARSANEQWYPDHAVMSATKDQLKALPQFKYN